MSLRVDDCHTELDEGGFNQTKAYALKDALVTIEYSSVNLVGEDSYFVPWVGTHKNVHYWVVTECRHAIGMNENPAIGISFPVVKLSQLRYDRLLNRSK